MTTTSEKSATHRGLPPGVPERTLSTLLSKAIRDHAQKVALVGDGEELTFAELGRRVEIITGWLRSKGLSGGSRVAVVSRNSVGFATIQVATQVAGFVGVWITARLGPSEVHYNVTTAGAEVVFVDRSWAERIDDVFPEGERPLVVCFDDGPELPGVIRFSEVLRSGLDDSVGQNERPTAESISLITFTSGTTGRPKGAVLSQSAMYNMVRNWLLSFPDLDGRDRVLHSAPLGHFSQVILFGSLTRGGSQYIMGKFDAGDLLDTVERERIEVLPLVPTQISAAVEEQTRQPRDVSSLVSIPYSASPIAPDRLRAAVTVFGAVFCQSYAQSEIMPPISILSKDDHQYALEAGEEGRRILASAGRPLPFVDVRIVSLDGEVLPPGEIGEVTVRSDTAMNGYWMDEANTAEAFTEDGWIRTGDMGSLSADGYLTIADRRKSMIISGGFNVYPVEVENVVYDLKWVREASVIGIPDERWGEAVIAVVALHADHAASADKESLAAELITHCKSRIADYKVPKRVDFMDDLPKGPTGKILPRLIREPYWEGRERSVV